MVYRVPSVWGLGFFGCIGTSLPAFSLPEELIARPCVVALKTLKPDKPYQPESTL